MLRLYPISLMAGFSNGSYTGCSSVLFTRISTDLRSVTCLRIPDVLSSPLCVQMKYSSRKLLLSYFRFPIFFRRHIPERTSVQNLLACTVLQFAQRSTRQLRFQSDFSHCMHDDALCTTAIYTYFLLPHPSNIRPIRPRSCCVSHIRDGKQIRFLAYRAIFTRPCFHRHPARPIILAKWTLKMKTV